MNSNSILKKNETEANRFAAKVMLATIGFVALVYVLDILEIFIAPILTMTIALSVATIFLLVPSIIVFLFKFDGAWVKYVIVSSAVMMVAFISAFLSFHVVLMYVYAIAIASLYFSRKLSWFAVLFSIAATSISQVVGLSSGGILDKNFGNAFEMALFGVAPRGIQLLVLALIFIMLSKRTRKMLENIMGAEEQKNILDRMVSITDKSFEVSNILAESVQQLSDITDNTAKANEQVAENTGKVAAGSEDTLKYVEEAAEAVVSISGNLNRIAEESKGIADISKQVNQLTENNSQIMKDAEQEMTSIDKATKDSKEIIHRLGERSSEIRRIVEIISGISGQTNLLALNAAIESARAGEQGRGFAVVASQIRNLAEQSENAAKNIAVLIKEVLADTERAVESMDKGSTMVGRGLQVINQAGKSSEEVSAASRQMNSKLQEVSSVTVDVAKSSDKIVGIVQNIREINYKSLEELQSIAAASEQQLASMQQVASSVDVIEKISGELLEVVKKSK